MRNRELLDEHQAIPSLIAYRALTQFGRLDTLHYPVLGRYSNAELYDNGEWLSPGGYLLMHLLVNKLNIRKGSRILDLGAGNGQSSIFLATEYDAEVVAIDLWIDGIARDERARKYGVSKQIRNIQADISEGLSEDLGTFDYIISVQAFHCFGAVDGMPRSLMPLLKKGGKFGIIQSCFNKAINSLPRVFLDSDGWEMDYENYHHPEWWRTHFRNNGYQVDSCEELSQGKEVWEDNILYYGNRYGWSNEYVQDYGWLIEQVLYDVDDFYLTHFLLTSTKA